MKILEKYFPGLTESQYDKFRQLQPLYNDWNARINVISRKDLENLFERHVLHSLAITRYITFSPGTQLLDVGTGGGFPGIPLAIYFPECQFVLIDSVAKKITVVSNIIKELGIENAEAVATRAESWKQSHDFILSRAVTKLPEFANLVRKNITKNQKNDLPNGILYLKGGDFDDELKNLKGFKSNVINLSQYFEEEFFQTKKLVHLF
jgi:16S rRNA (guanine527-N7)-methyltransferase